MGVLMSAWLLSGCVGGWDTTPNSDPNAGWIKPAVTVGEGDGRVFVTYRVAGTQTAGPRYEVYALANDTPFFNPGNGEASRLVIKREAARTVMAKVCQPGDPVFAQDVSGWIGGPTIYSVSCQPAK
jgi:hypothetical protein